MNIPQFSVRRPVFTTMVTLIVIIIGTVSLNRLRIDLLPNIELPTLTVRTSYEGASPEVMERLVTQILEEIINLMNTGTVHIVADFKELRYVNSTGLGILLHFSKTAKEKGGTFKITNVNEHVYEIIEIIGATTLLDIFENVEEALKTL